MEILHLNALRFGFSTKDASKIHSLGLSKYISNQLHAKIDLAEPQFIKESPKSLADLRKLKQSANKGNKELEKIVKNLLKIHLEWKAFLVERFFETAYPLREKINLFFQNHFVVTLQSVNVPYWIFQHYHTIHQHAIGNYKTLVKEMVYSNAMIKYLDNQQNKKGKINENLARELLELFTLGEGNYTEKDIKNTAMALAGLSFGKSKGQYRAMLMDNSSKIVLGKTGNFTIDEVIDIIFEQKNTPYFLAEKVLRWFFYDNPSHELVHQYGNLLKEKHFELKPFFQEMFEQEGKNEKGGNQIKNPLIYFAQIHYDLHLTPNYKLIALLLKNQSMDIYDQPNVKGWKGGQNWLTSQIYADRNQFIDFVIDGNKQFKKILSKKLEKFDLGTISYNPKLKILNPKNAESILYELTQKMLFETDEDMKQELNQLLNYDFDPTAENAEKSILKVYQFLAKSPEFQII